MFLDFDKAKDALGRDYPLSHFVFRKISLEHLEEMPLGEGKELVLKFRRATFLDHQKFREEYDGKALEKASGDILETVMMIYRFLTKESRRSLLNIKFTDINDKGEEFPVEVSLPDVFKQVLISSVNSHQDVYNLFLEIFGYTKEQLETLDKVQSDLKKKANPKSTPMNNQSPSS